jgi:hypothetical protein
MKKDNEYDLFVKLTIAVAIIFGFFAFKVIADVAANYKMS